MYHFIQLVNIISKIKLANLPTLCTSSISSSARAVTCIRRTLWCHWICLLQFLLAALVRNTFVNFNCVAFAIQSGYLDHKEVIYNLCKRAPEFSRTFQEGLSFLFDFIISLAPNTAHVTKALLSSHRRLGTSYNNTTLRSLWSREV